MTDYHGGQVVKKGIYLKYSTWEFESVAGGGGILPGDRETRYISMPLPAVIVAGPLMGLAYLISLPIAFCLAFSYFLARRVGRTVKIRNMIGSLLMK